jgi:hypothetical protein
MDRSSEKSFRVREASVRAAVLIGVAAVCGCAASRPGPVVPERTQQRSQELYGQQQRSMDSFNQTPSEQAGERFEADTKPARPVEEQGGER